MPRQHRLSRVAVVALRPAASGNALMPAAAQTSGRVSNLPLLGLVPRGIVGLEAGYTAAHINLVATWVLHPSLAPDLPRPHSVRRYLPRDRGHPHPHQRENARQGRCIMALEPGD